MRLLRIADIVLSISGILVGFPILVLAAGAIRMESEGAAIFAQHRVGQGQRQFICYKLRTMALGTVQGPSHEVGRASITRVGAFLRRTKIDELPQLWNVLRGDMSLVGPRPCLPDMHALIVERELRGVHALRPGITGPAQIAGLEMSDPVALASADAAWLEQASLGRYLAILLATVLGRGRGDAAAR